MKTFVLSCALLAIVSAFNNLHAQCTVSTPVISNIQKNGNNITFDLSFNLQGNGGNKITAVYIFNTADYSALPANFYGQNNNSVPNITSLNNAKALATIKINLDSTTTVYNYQKVSNYFVRPTSMQSNLAYQTDVSGQITIKNIALTFSNVTSLISLRADVLSSQSPDLSSVGCIAKGLSFSPNEPIIRALDNGCGGTRSLTASFITTEARTVSFKIYKDVEPLLQFTAADTAAANAVSAVYTATTVYNSTEGDYRIVGNYSYTDPGTQNFSVWVVANTSGVPNISAAITANQCAPLPITLPTVFASVSAQREKQQVVVKWQTATEEENRGFYVQRQIGNGNWQNLGFVASRAHDGTSANLLSYSFIDQQPERGISNYRVQLVGLNGKTGYSAIRSVKSEDIAAKLVVYPNPSSDGKITLVFDAASSVKNVMVSDMSGRVVKQFTGIRQNNLVIENLGSGLYTIQVIDQAHSAVSMEKVLIKNR